MAKNWTNGGDTTLSVGLGVSAPSLAMSILNNQDDEIAKELRFSPNKAGKTKLSFQYGNLGFSVSASNGLSASNDKTVIDVPLETSSTDFQCRFLGARHGFVLYYQKYRSYYIDNYAEYDDTLNNASESILYPGLSTTHKGIGYTYNFYPERLSLDAAFGIGDLQLKPSSGFFLTASFDRHTISSTTSLTPSFSNNEFSFIEDFRGGVFNSLAIGGGAAIIHVNEKLFISGLLMFAGMAQDAQIEFADSKESKVQFSLKGTLGVSLGYNTMENKIALQLIGDSLNVPIKTGKLSFQSVTVDLLYVHRFSDIKIPFLQKASSWFNL